MTPAAVVREALSWVGTPYRRKGRTRSGVDCLGLLVVVAQAFEVPHEDQPDYSDWPDPGRLMLKRFGTFLRMVPSREIVSGGIGVLTQTTRPAHVGFFSRDAAGGISLIHARIDTGCVVSEPFRRDDPLSETRLIRLYVFPGLEISP